MSFLAKLAANKWIVLAILVGVGIWFLVVPAFTPGRLGANPLEKLLHRTGEIAVWTLGAVLALTPLRTLLPRSQIVAGLNRHRRAIGVAAGIYAVLHLACHVVYQGDIDEVLRSFTTPFIWFGAAGLVILLTLVVTSNNLSMRLMGGRNWKRLHRLAYLAAALALYHQGIAGKGHWYIAKYLFFLLVGLEGARVLKLVLARKPAPARSAITG